MNSKIKGILLSTLAITSLASCSSTPSVTREEGVKAALEVQNEIETGSIGLPSTVKYSQKTLMEEKSAEIILGEKNVDYSKNSVTQEAVIDAENHYAHLKINMDYEEEDEKGSNALEIWMYLENDQVIFASIIDDEKAYSQLSLPDLSKETWYEGTLEFVNNFDFTNIFSLLNIIELEKALPNVGESFEINGLPFILASLSFGSAGEGSFAFDAKLEISDISKYFKEILNLPEETKISGSGYALSGATWENYLNTRSFSKTHMETNFTIIDPATKVEIGGEYLLHQESEIKVDYNVSISTSKPNIDSSWEQQTL